MLSFPFFDNNDYMEVEKFAERIPIKAPHYTEAIHKNLKRSGQNPFGEAVKNTPSSKKNHLSSISPNTKSKKKDSEPKYFRKSVELDSDNELKED